MKAKIIGLVFAAFAALPLFASAASAHGWRPEMRVASYGYRGGHGERGWGGERRFRDYGYRGPVRGGGCYRRW